MAVSRNLINMLFVALLITALLCGASAPEAGQLPASAEDTTPLKSGAEAPSFDVKTVDNDVFSFDPGALDKPVVLISFRGGWCPYCNLHLSELRKVIPEIRAMGYDVLFISNDRPEILYASLEDQAKEDVAALDYTILSDAELNAAVAFGTAFQASDGLKDWMTSKNKDIKDSSIARHNALSVPFVYVISTDGEIVFDYVNPNYKVRISNDDLMAAASKAAP